MCDRARACVSVGASVCKRECGFVLACARKDRLAVVVGFVYYSCSRKGMFHIYMSNDACSLNP